MRTNQRFPALSTTLHVCRYRLSSAPVWLFENEALCGVGGVSVGTSGPAFLR